MSQLRTQGAAKRWLVTGLLFLAVVAGAFPVAADDSTAPEAVGDRSQAGFDVAHSAFNRFETVLNRTNVSNLTELWVSPPGFGNIYTSPVVSEGKLFMGSQDGFMYAFDAATGETLWVGPDEGTLFTSAAAVGNGLVFSSALFRVMRAYDAETGEVVWSLPFCQVRAAPALSKGTLYVANFDGTLLALDAVTGAAKWSKAGGCCIYDQSPLVDGGRVFQMRTNDTLTAYDARTGSQLWQVTGYFTSGTIAASRGVLYFKDFPNVIALNAATGAELWRADIGAGGHGAPAVANGRVYVTESADSSNSELTVLDATTGAVIWSVPSVASTEGPSVANGVVYASDLSGKWDAYDARNGASLWTVTIGGGCGGACTNAVPTVSNGILYVVGADGTLRAYSLP